MWDTIQTQLAAQLATNQFLTGGALLMALGTAGALLRGLPHRAWAWAHRRFVRTLSVRSGDVAFGWLQLWLHHRLDPDKHRNLVLSTAASDDDDEAARMPRVVLTPAPGWYLLRDGLRWFVLEVERGSAKDEKGGFAKPEETITLSTLGGGPALWHDLVAGAWRLAQEVEAPGVKVYTWSWSAWVVRGRKPRRDPGTLILEAGLYERLQADVDDFLASRAWYEGMGVPWKRGYLLHGPPGNGKSSLVIALATALDASIYHLNLANGELSDDKLAEAIAGVPRGQIVLIEEIDTTFAERKRSDDAQASRVTFGGLLNALDGIAAAEGVLLVMTTNHREKLDPALVRPGRADLHLLLDDATDDQVARLYRRFWPAAPAAWAQLAAERFGGRRHGMAVLQELFMRHRHDPEGVLAAQPERREAEVGAETPRPSDFRGEPVGV